MTIKVKHIVWILSFMLVLSALGGVFAVEDIRRGVIMTIQETFHDTFRWFSYDGGRFSDVDVKDTVDVGSISNDRFAEENPPKRESVESGVEKDPNLQIYFLEGKGSSVLIREEKTFLIDSMDRESVDRLLSFLKDLNILSLDYLLLTNYHDSAFKGAEKLLDRVDVKYILLAENLANHSRGNALRAYLNNKKLVWTLANEDTLVGLGLSKVRFVKTHDDGSVLVVLQNGENKFLFTGDITRIDERALKQLPPSVDILSLSTRNDFYVFPKQLFSVVQPTYVIIGSNKENKPFLDVQKIFESHNIPYYPTHVYGDIVVKSNGEKVSIFLD